MAAAGSADTIDHFPGIGNGIRHRDAGGAAADSGSSGADEGAAQRPRVAGGSRDRWSDGRSVVRGDGVPGFPAAAVCALAGSCAGDISRRVGIRTAASAAVWLRLAAWRAAHPGRGRVRLDALDLAINPGFDDHAFRLQSDVVPGILRGGQQGTAIMVETIQWTEDGVVMIDQTRLPRQEVFVTCRTYGEVADAIRSMVIRGAPAIGVAAAMGVALGVLRSDDRFEDICDTLARTRPTAVNLFWAIVRMKKLYESLRGRPIEEIRARLVSEAQGIRLEDIAINRRSVTT